MYIGKPCNCENGVYRLMPWHHLLSNKSLALISFDKELK